MIETKILNKDGEAVAYITPDYTPIIYLWDGNPVAYLHEKKHIYGINGGHLGWFIDEILYTNEGERIGFTVATCPVSVAKEPVKGKKRPRDEFKTRWEQPSSPKFGYQISDRDLKTFLAEGRFKHYPGSNAAEETPADEISASKSED